MTEPIVCRSAAEFAAHLTAIREAHGYSQRRLARELHTYSADMSRRENGLAVPRLDSAIRWAAGLGYGLALIPLPRPPLVVDVHLPDEDVIP